MLHVNVYRFAPKWTAFRNDYCRPCAHERISIRTRTFNMLGVMWIPLIPLGFQQRWICSECRQPTRANTRTRHGYKIAGILMLLLMAPAMWWLPLAEIPPEDHVWIWGMRIGLPLLLAWSIYHLRTATREPEYDEAFARVQPYTSRMCPFCNVDLLNVPAWHCPTCGLERM